MDCYIINSLRTGRGKGKKDGSLHIIPPMHLACELLKHAKSLYPSIDHWCDDAILGCVMPVGEQGGNICRSALLASGYDQSLPGLQINRFCSSGLDAIAMAACKIASGQANMMIAGGVESMSRVPMLSDGGALLLDPSVNFAHNIIPQGISADLIASIEGYDRKLLDEYAAISHQRAHHAHTKGFFSSIVPIRNILGEVILDRDEMVRDHVSAQSMSHLSPSFEQLGKMAQFDSVALQKYPMLEKIQHLHHAGNSSGIADGAALSILANEAMIKTHNLSAQAQILGYEVCGIDPTIMLSGPALATQKLLKRMKLNIDDIDVFEINEAFSAVVLKTMHDLNITHDKTNILGGAIAMGHPLGATGAIILGTCVEALKSSGGKLGVVSLCTAAGMAVSVLIKNLEDD